jgi:hypothetical protein
MRLKPHSPNPSALSDGAASVRHVAALPAGFGRELMIL